ncbi:MAG TPA: hypothetical protein GXZ23_02430 [Clostridiales bacterium]|nr:hypothetical protein [Clostridiales bacterium]
MKKILSVILTLVLICVPLSVGVIGADKELIYNESAILNPGNEVIVREFPQNKGGKKGLINQDKLFAENLPAQYDLRNVDGVSYVTDVKDQGELGNCWAFSAVGAIESNRLKDGAGDVTTLNYSEAHLVWFTYNGRTTDENDGTYGDGYAKDDVYNCGGYWGDVTGNLARWSGVTNEEAFPYYKDDVSQMGNYPESDRYLSEAHLENVSYYEKDEQNAIKSTLMENGAMTMSIYYNEIYLSQTNAYYVAYALPQNHDVLCVGWDDNYDKNNFNATIKPEGNGAWICRNSWNTDWGDNGYFYVSYYSGGIGPFVSFDISDNTNFDKNYQYDGTYFFNSLYFNNVDEIDFGNIFTSESYELLEAVSFYTLHGNATYTVNVYTDVDIDAASPLMGAKVADATTSGDIETLGYHTIRLANPVELLPNERFSVVVTIKTKDGSVAHAPVEGSGNAYEKLVFSSKIGQSFIGSQNTWFDTSTEEGYYSNNVNLKAFTSNIDEIPDFKVTPANKSVVVGKTVTLTALNVPEGYEVVWTSSDETIATVDENGVVTTIKEGKATITATVTLDDDTTITAESQITVTPVPEPPVEPEPVPSIWERILAFFRKIIEFIKKLFSR